MTSLTTLILAAGRIDQMDHHLWHDIAGSLGYNEADTLAFAFHALESDTQAYTLMVAWWLQRDPEDDDERAPELVRAWLSTPDRSALWDEAALAYAGPLRLGILSSEVHRIAAIEEAHGD